ncbi:MAG: dihydropteroate synthase [Planctomycetes bacterium]|nr:dihydropteroate synthase [Planctomycetota bacterium]
MATFEDRLSKFIIIGENVHCSRRVKLDGPRCLKDGGKEYVVWKDKGQPRRMEIPDWFKKDNQHYNSGLVSHCHLAVEYGLRDDPIGAEYIQWVAKRQIEKGGNYLDVNIDEVSPSLEKRLASMDWIIPVTQKAAGKVPLSVDSSNTETIVRGLKAYDYTQSTPMLNSISLERLEVVDICVERKLPAIVMASGAAGMPHSVDERLENLREMIGICRKKGLKDGGLYIDVLIYPKSASAKEGLDGLLAMEAVRKEFGEEVHIAGGHSNFSFGMPLRHLINAVWLDLAIQRGCDSGIVDPITVDPGAVKKLDRSAEYYTRTSEMILNEDDELVMNYLSDARDGNIEDPFEKK